MDTIPDPPDLRENLETLQTDSIKALSLFSGLIGYIWLFLLLWFSVTSLRDASLTAWLGATALTLSSGVGLVLSNRRLRVASNVFAWGCLASVFCLMLASHSLGRAYLFVTPVIFASVLLGQVAFILVATAAVLGPLILGLLWASPTISPPDALSPALAVALPIGSIVLVTLGSWFSARNLRTALAWVWAGYSKARLGEQLERERAAELRRALKALDEATHRLERLNYTLARTRDQAEEARRLKQQFAQTISHELRTPLNLIVGFSELMTESPEYYGGSLLPGYQRDLNIIHRNASHLQALVNDVLDLARIDAAQMSIIPEETDLGALVQEAVNTARGLIEARNLALHVHVEPGLPHVWVDPTRIRQVLINLLNNAARFTEKGSVTVDVRQKGECAILAVKDTGVGIARKDLSRIFEEFHQADGGTRRQHGGAGLGLTISKRFVELHGGSIEVESQVGVGSTFSFSLPLGKAELLVDAGQSSGKGTYHASTRGTERPMILAVTRSQPTARLLARHQDDSQTVVLPDLDQARHLARQVMPQMVVIDRTSVELALADLEALAREWDLPQTTFVSCPFRRQARLEERLAVEGYLTKPVSRQNLWNVLRGLGEDVDRVLVIDDDLDFVQLMTRMLVDNPVRRYQVFGAYGGQEGLELVRLHQPDLVLLDLGLPDLDGLQVLEQMRSSTNERQIPIVIVSAQEELEERQSLTGGIMIVRGEGMTPGEVMRWTRVVLDSTIKFIPARRARQADLSL
jgi:signal transduction histidine kinase/DNA-binding response OmpR family regulator